MLYKSCGAAREVTGSRHLFEIGGKKILFDCGFFQGGNTHESEEKNRNFLFDPKEVTALVLSHAHIDHAGNIPRLVKRGFRGAIHCTSITKELMELLLLDSAKIQKQDADHIYRHQHRKVEPLYDESDVRQAMKQVEIHEYNEKFEISGGCRIEFIEAGHVLGSAITLAEFREPGKEIKLIYTGDLGRRGMPILNDPALPGPADVLITESTYGSHLHESINQAKDELNWIINDVIGRGGKIIVPGFSLERTQELVYLLNQLYEERKIPKVPVYVDSPLSTKISQIFIKHPEAYDKETAQLFLNKRKSPFYFEGLHYIVDKAESMALNSLKHSAIIISASGMCQAGRIQHHLKFNVSDSKNLILVVGYMARGTLGRALVEKERTVTILGEKYPLRAEVVVLNSFSAHADKHELLEFARNIKGLRKIFCVHGEETESLVLRDNLYNINRFAGKVEVPVLGQEFYL
ncbi:MAG: MBL fold metallo-hydrolase [Patescibacteria group bacterium]